MSTRKPLQNQKRTARDFRFNSQSYRAAVNGNDPLRYVGYKSLMGIMVTNHEVDRQVTVHWGICGFRQRRADHTIPVHGTAFPLVNDSLEIPP